MENQSDDKLQQELPQKKPKLWPISLDLCQGAMDHEQAAMRACAERALAQDQNPDNDDRDERLTRSRRRRSRRMSD
jgi:hypothetical protein